DRGDIRLFANVEYGADISLGELTDRYDAVIFSTGCFVDAPLALPGIDLPGSHGAADFVNWYDAHPDVPQTWPLTPRRSRCSATAMSPSTSPACWPSRPMTCTPRRSPTTCTRD